MSKMSYNLRKRRRRTAWRPAPVFHRSRTNQTRRRRRITHRGLKKGTKKRRSREAREEARLTGFLNQIELYTFLRSQGVMLLLPDLTHFKIPKVKCQSMIFEIVYKSPLEFIFVHMEEVASPSTTFSSEMNSPPFSSEDSSDCPTEEEEEPIKLSSSATLTQPTSQCQFVDSDLSDVDTDILVIDIDENEFL